MKITDILTLVSDELRDSRTTKYSKTSMLLKLKEAATQFVQDSKILKNSVQILPIAGQAVYPLPVFGTAFDDRTGVPHATGASTSLVVPTYLSAIRIGWRSNFTTPTSQGGGTTVVTNKLLQPNSTFERDEAGMVFYKAGTPNYLYNDELNFHEFGVWPTPDAVAIDSIATNPVGAEYRFQIDYVRDVLYYTDLAGTTLSADQENITENDYLDPSIPVQFQRKLYLLICYLRLKNSIDQSDVAKSAIYKQMYIDDLLKPALESGNHMDRYNQILVSN